MLGLLTLTYAVLWLCAPAHAEKPTVIVVGTGLAGLVASAEAHQLGAKVIALEKMSRHGGNSAKATSGINGVGTRGQQLLQIEDSAEQFKADTIKSGRGTCTEELVDVLANKAGEAVSFLEGFGIDLSNLCQCGGHSSKRTHREPNKPNGAPRPVGFDLVSVLHKHLTALPSDEFELRTNVRVTTLLEDPFSHYVVGVTYTNASSEENADEEPTELMGDAVILATGGYSWDTTGFLDQFRPELAFLPTSNGPWATGDGLRLALHLRAAVRLMDQVQVHPTGFVDPKDPDARVKFLAPEAFRGSGGILLNFSGQRFVNELGPRDMVTGSIYRFSPKDPASVLPDHLELPVHQQPPVPSEAFLLLTAPMVEAFGSAAFGFYHKVKGFFTEVTGPQGIADHISTNATEEVSSQAVAASLEAYAAAGRGEAKDVYGKTVFPVVPEVGEDVTYFLARITPLIHYTMGGLAIDAEARVLRHGLCNAETDPANCERLEVVKGLFAAGEVTGGVHGDNRLAGNSLLECTVFGRVAAQAALKQIANREQDMADMDDWEGPVPRHPHAEPVAEPVVFKKNVDPLAKEEKEEDDKAGQGQE